MIYLQVIIDSAASLSYELYTEFELLVTATDGGGQTDTATVVVHLVPYNDATPVFIPSSTYTYIYTILCHLNNISLKFRHAAKIDSLTSSEAIQL